MISDYRWYSKLPTCGIITGFIKRSIKHYSNVMSQAFHLSTMIHSNKMALFPIMYLKYIDIFPAFGNYSMFGNS